VENEFTKNSVIACSVSRHDTILIPAFCRSHLAMLNRVSVYTVHMYVCMYVVVCMIDKSFLLKRTLIDVFNSVYHDISDNASTVTKSPLFPYFSS
jgi:hypothetical protein